MTETQKCLDSVTRMIAPIACITAEDLYQSNPTKQFIRKAKNKPDSVADSVFVHGWVDLNNEWKISTSEQEGWILFRDVLRPMIFREIELVRNKSDLLFSSRSSRSSLQVH